MKHNTISKLICSAAACGMFLTCAAVSAFAAADEGTAYVFIRDTDNKYIYEGAANDKTNTLAVDGASDSDREANGTVKTQTVTADKEYTVSVDLGSASVEASDLALKIDGVKHPDKVKIDVTSFKINGEDVKLESSPSSEVDGEDITLVFYRSSGEKLFNRDTSQISKADVTFSVENWYTGEEEETKAEETTVEQIKDEPKAEDTTVEQIKDVPANDTATEEKPSKTGDAGLVSVLAVGTAAFAGVWMTRKKK